MVFVDAHDFSKEQRLKELVRLIKEADQAYYVEDRPHISDYEYDLLLRELEALEKQYPEWRQADSPTKRVAGKAAGGFGQSRHLAPFTFFGQCL